MREAIGSAFLYNVIIVFIFMIFMFIMSTLIYYKAFKSSKMILTIIEKYEGYNEFSKKEISTHLSSIGYSLDRQPNCPSRKENGETVTNESTDPRYCMYYIPSDVNERYLKETYYTYGVTTFITIDFPILNTFITVPIYIKSGRIFNFGFSGSVGGYPAGSAP